ncbi:hypothetical protein HK097_009974 [Rhizophlyctis rosea]|uniref:Carboxylesterase type B domain-containing protein n=1 Tax=Rhizophlyctis rosea TaxID=64517 RepID=A0AAD5X030_9FUNG|nr:hypothetical protein HK097_009974 [Rhizophlyctis rosea]
MRATSAALVLGGLPAVLALAVPPAHKSVIVVTDNDYNTDPHTWLAIKDDRLPYSSARKICAEYDEDVATLPTSSLQSAALIALQKAGIEEAWISVPYKSCTAFNTKGKKGAVSTQPCSKNLPVLCNNNAFPTTRENLANGVEPSVKVTPPAGPILGGRDNYAFRFTGIPYASPPIGSRRFALPVLPPKFKTPFPALKYAPQCPAPYYSTPNVDPTHWDEDCLYINIHTPRVGTDSKLLPVLFWIHGGALVGGGIADLSDNLGNFVSRNQVVLVAVQYRLGMFGWLGDNKSVPQNLGLHDMVLALKWINQNIPYFSGDTSRVTIAGQSAGAYAVRALINTPSAKNLFHKAVVHSDIQFQYWSSGLASNITAKAMEGLGCDEVECLRGKSVQDILAAGAAGVGAFPLQTWGIVMPTLDGKLVDRQFYDSVKSGKFNKVPFINTNMNDDSGFAPLLTSPVTVEAAESFLTLVTGSADLAKMVTSVPYYKFNTSAEADNSLAFHRAFTNLMFACPARYLTKLMNKQGVPARVAEWRWGGPGPAKTQLCNYKDYWCHNDDLPILWGNNTLGGTTPSAIDRRVQRVVGDLWTAFGGSSPSELKKDKIAGIKWPVSDVEGSSGLVINKDMEEEVGDFADERCDEFDRAGAYSFLRGYATA